MHSTRTHKAVEATTASGIWPRKSTVRAMACQPRRSRLGHGRLWPSLSSNRSSTHSEGLPTVLAPHRRVLARFKAPRYLRAYNDVPAAVIRNPERLA
jgi:hypothetical protein